MTSAPAGERPTNRPPGDRPICPVTGAPGKFYCKKDGHAYYLNEGSGIIFQSPLPEVKDMESYADQEYAEGAYRNYVQAEALKKKTGSRRLKLIQQLIGSPKGRKLIDVGCSCGFFLEEALRAGYEVCGVEFSSVAISQAHPSVRDRIICADVNELSSMSNERYDVVTAFDIIEHTQRPVAFVESLKRLLRPDGLLVMTTPDTGHWLRYLMGARWPMLQPM